MVCGNVSPVKHVYHAGDEGMSADASRKPGRASKSLTRLGGIARTAFVALEELPNVGPALAADLRLIGVSRPAELVGRDPFVMYDELCRATGQRHDPCVIDQFIAAVRFMEGGEAKPWWAFTAERKREREARGTNRRGDE